MVDSTRYSFHGHAECDMTHERQDWEAGLGVCWGIFAWLGGKAIILDVGDLGMGTEGANDSQRDCFHRSVLLNPVCKQFQLQ